MWKLRRGALLNFEGNAAGIDASEIDALPACQEGGRAVELVVFFWRPRTADGLPLHAQEKADFV